MIDILETWFWNFVCLGLTLCVAYGIVMVIVWTWRALRWIWRVL